MENAEFEYEDDFEAYEEEEEVEKKLWSFPPLPLMPSLAHTSNACDLGINTEINSFLDIMLDESEPESIDDSLGQNDEDTKTTGSRDDAAKEKKEPTVRDTKKRTVTFYPKGTTGQPLAVSEILKEGLAAPDNTSWDEVVNLRIEILRREHRRSQVKHYTGHVGVVQEKPEIEEGALGAIDYDRSGMEIMIKSLDKDVKSSSSIISNETANQDDIANEENNNEEPEVDDGDATETDLCTDPSLEYLEECTPLQVFYQPYPSDITLPVPVPVPEVKIKMVRLSRTVADILFRRITPYVPPPEKQGPKVWNTFQKVAEIDVQEKIDVDPKEDRPKKSFLRRLVTFFRKRSSKVVPVSS